MSDDRFTRIGNNLSADFANTVVSFERDGGSLHDPGDVIDFLLATGALATRDEAAARAAAAGDPAFVARTRALRDAVTEALSSIESRRPVAPDALALINRTLGAGTATERVVPAGDRYTVELERLSNDPLALLSPIARDVAHLLATPHVPLRKCAAADCVRHFYDDSRTGRRRWCDMGICGNRAKAAAFAARRRHQ